MERLILLLVLIFASLTNVAALTALPRVGVRWTPRRSYSSLLTFYSPPIHRQRPCPVLFESTFSSGDESASSSADDEEPAKEEDSSSIEESGDSSSDDSSKLKRFGKSIRNYFKGPDDGLTTKQRLAKLGLSAALSYGWVSNMSYSVTVSLAWYIFCKQTGLSPLAKGQWPKFLAVYAGFWVFNNIVRPIRVAMAVGISPQFDKFVKGIKERLNCSQGMAVFVTVMLANLVGTLAAMSLGIFLASMAAGVPVFPPKVLK
jgi:hypothetical protein